MEIRFPGPISRPEFAVVLFNICCTSKVMGFIWEVFWVLWLEAGSPEKGSEKMSETTDARNPITFESGVLAPKEEARRPLLPHRLAESLDQVRPVYLKARWQIYVYTHMILKSMCTTICFM